jgi:ATP-dependent DNA helicase RecG
MNEKELKKLLENLLKKGECEYVEFKKDFFILDKFFEYYSALSNSATIVGEDFGYLVYGVSDDGGICGTTVNKEEGKLKERIAKVFGNSHDFEIFKFEYKEKNITIYKIPCTKAKIASFKNKKTDAYESFYRVGSSNKSIAKSDDYQKIYKKIALFGDDWSAIAVDDANINDLDDKALKLAISRYKEKNPKLNIKNWSIENFLERVGLIKDSKLINACLVLLGKKESAYKLKNSSESVEILWRLDTLEEKASQYFSPPLILSTSEAWSLIRNPKYKIYPANELIAREVDKYDQKVFLEALHNCIAHQDYFAGKRIRIVEKIDKLIFTNAGNFYDGKAEDYVLDIKSVASKYRNKALVDAMREFGMIDKLGSGVKAMYETQRKKYFPLPTYSYNNNDDETGLEIYGKEIDKKFTEILINKGDMEFYKTIMLDKIQKNRGAEVDEDEARKLAKEKLIEGRRPNYILSAKVSEILGREVEHTEKKGFSDDEISNFIIKHLKNFPNGQTRIRINDLVKKYLPGILNEKQKSAKINNILTKLTRRGIIKNFGNDRNSLWKFLQNK